MGKAARLRRERKVDDTRIMIEKLQVANLYVGRTFETEQACIEAVALLVRTADLLGYEIIPRAVSIAAQGRTGHIAMGPRAAAAFGQPWDDKHSGGWDGAGHLIGTLEDPPYIFDPSAQQMSAHLGEPASVITASVNDFEPPDRQFGFQDGTLKVAYYLVPTDQTWVESYERCLDPKLFPRREELAHQIAEIVNAGPGVEAVLVKD